MTESKIIAEIARVVELLDMTDRSDYGSADDLADEWFRDVANAIASPKGQAFLRELADALDALPDKALIEEELIDEEGNCCAVGAVCKARGIDATHMDSAAVAEWLGAPLLLVAEIIDVNDGYRETPVHRWHRMRRWVDRHITQGNDQ